MLLKSLFLIFFFLNFVTGNKVFNISTRIEISSRAIASFVDIMKEKYFLEFNLVLVGNDKNLDILANKIKRRSNAPLTIKFDKKIINSIDLNNLIENKSTILIVSDERIEVSFNDTNLNTIDFEPYKRYYFLLHYLYTFAPVSFYSSKKISPDDRLFSLHHTLDGNMSIIGNEMVSENSCVPITRSLNTFSPSEMKWKSTNFIPQYTNFYECPLNVCAIVNEQLDFSFLIVQNETLSGFALLLFPVFAEKFNTGKIDFVPKYDNGQYSAINLMQYRILYQGKYEINFDELAETYPIYYMQYAFIATKGISYTPMEKLFLPFDLETWIMILITFAIGFLTIFIIYRCNRFVQRFVFGTFVQDPSLYLTSIFFGIGVTRLPGRNFARYLFMIFTLYCLIIRTAYQGKMFEFLNKDVKRPTAKTEQDLIDWKIPLIKLNLINIHNETMEHLGSLPTRDDK
jgi:hypothetical protein